MQQEMLLRRVTPLQEQLLQEDSRAEAAEQRISLIFRRRLQTIQRKHGRAIALHGQPQTQEPIRQLTAELLLLRMVT